MVECRVRDTMSADARCKNEESNDQVRKEKLTMNTTGYKCAK